MYSCVALFHSVLERERTIANRTVGNGAVAEAAAAALSGPNDRATADGVFYSSKSTYILPAAEAAAAATTWTTEERTQKSSFPYYTV